MVSTYNDSDLATWLKSKPPSLVLAYAHANHIFGMFEVGTNDASIFFADLEKESLLELKRFAKKGKLKRIELSVNELSSTQTVNPSWNLLSASVRDVSDFYKKRTDLLGQGRGKKISQKTEEEVWHDAGGRCMYRGCGQNLGYTSLTTKTARIAYLAHIVASDPDGPRGNSDSHKLSNDSENIMLMCDAHHRLIDRIDVLGHPTNLLQTMREEHKQRVNYLLKNLAFPRAKIVTLLADLGQVPTNTSQKELIESVLRRQASPSNYVFNAIRRTQRDDRNRQDFWWHFLHEHENDIRNFTQQASSLFSQNGEAQPDKLAVFPLHLVPVLVIAGCVIGEAQPVEVFQYDRHRHTWCWDALATPFHQGSISTSPLSTATSEEVVLSIELTAPVDEKALPNNLAAAIHNQSMPWIRIVHASPDFGCMRCAEDLEQFTSVARQVVRVIQDQILAKHVHFIGIAPASTLFRFGQLLQAGHHPLYQIYDRSSHVQSFKPALTISGTQITAYSENGAEPFSISLR